MELKYLQEFVVLAEIGNYTPAADELYISQSSLTKHIKSLESELGVPLFERTTRKVSLTPYGRALLPYAMRIVAVSDELNEALVRMTRDTDTTLRLGVLPSFMAYGVMDAMTQLKKQHPTFSITLKEGGLNDLKKELIEGQCNVIITRKYQPEEDSRFAAVALQHDRPVVVMPFGHPMDDGGDVFPIEKLEGQEIITSNSVNMERMLRELAEQANVHFNIPIRLGRSEHIIRMMQAENRLAVLLKKPTEYNYGGMFRIMDLQPSRQSTVVAMYLKDEPLNAAARAFLKTLKEICAEEDHGETAAQ